MRVSSDVNWLCMIRGLVVVVAVRVSVDGWGISSHPSQMMCDMLPDLQG
jgi:hypothetical protein